METALRLELAMPLLLDEMDNRASVAFAAWPERLVLVGADGRIVDPGSPGPWGFSPDEARAQLVSQLQRGAARPEAESSPPMTAPG